MLDALVAGMPLFIDVFLVTAFLMSIFGIMGVQLYKNSMHRRCQVIGSDEMSADDNLGIGAGLDMYCGNDLYGGMYKRKSEDQCCTNGVCAMCKLFSKEGHTCPRGTYCHVVGSTTQLANEGWTRFDNIGISMFTLFEMMTLEGWTELMYACQMADSTASSWYFVSIILLFSFILVNLYIAVIVQTFAKIRTIRDKETAEEAVANAAFKVKEDERIRLEQENRELSIKSSNPLANLAPLQPSFGTKDQSPPEQIYAFLRSLELEQYHESVMQMVETIEELYLVDAEALINAGWKLIHIRRFKDAVLAPPAFQSNASYHGVQDWDPMSPNAKTPSEEMYAFLRSYHLDQYHPVLIKLVDNLDELARLSVADFESQGLKLLHARNLEQALLDRNVAKPQVGEESLNPALITILEGTSVGMWRANFQRGSPFWQSCFGNMLLNIWYREDPQIDWVNPPPPAPRTNFIMPFQWTGCIGQLIASDAFEGVISVAIVANIVCMSLDYNDAPSSYRALLSALSFCFFVIFLVEMGLKFKGMGGLKWYFAVGFNTFDFVLVWSAFPDAIAYLAGTQPFINLSMLRVFRLFRMFKLIRSMRQLLEVVASAGKAIGNLIIFIFFFVLIFAIFGMQMFSGKCREEDGSIPRTNFDGTGDALLALFQTMTGEDWTGIMWNVMREFPWIGLIFFLIFYIMANYILMEMFCAVILENFQLTTEEKDNLQIELYACVQKKKAAAKALADSVDKDLAEKLKAEMEKQEAEAAKAREKAIREKNEGGAAPAGEEETPEAKKKREEAKAKSDAALKAKIMEEARAAQPVVEENDDVGDYIKEDAGDGMELGELDDGPKKKEKKNSLPPSAIVEKTCYLFDQEHQFRQVMYQVEQTKAFEYTVFFAILMGCVFLASDTPFKPNPDITSMIEVGSPMILAIYNIELMVKVVSKGMFGKPSAYINDPWNRVDFAVLVMSDLAMFLKLIGLDGLLPSSLIMAFRTLRVVRPLRLINQNERIQIVFNALFMSLPAILNVMTLLMFCLFMFSILGMGLYMGLFFACNQDVANKDQCIGYSEGDGGFLAPVVWDNPRYSFDNVFLGVLVLFESSTLEGWVDVMHSCQDINGTPGGTTAKFEPTIPPLQPEQNKALMQCLFIIAYICFGVFFVLNLVMGVMIEKFNQISGRGILTDDQKMYKDTILQANLHDERQPLGRPGGAVRGWCYTTCMHPNFENTVLFLITANAALMASEHYDQSKAWEGLIAMVNLILTFVFTVEITIRIIAIFPKQFFADPWNVMDFFIVVSSLLMIPLDGIVELTFMRPFRLLLLFRIIKRAKGIRLMIMTLLLSLPALFNVTCMLFLCYFIYAILGMSWWSNLKFNDAIGLPAHYRTFADALCMLARTTTGEGWNAMLHDSMVVVPDCTDYFGSSTDGWGTDLTELKADTVINGSHYWLANDCGNPAYAVIFYVSFNIVGTFCMINLFVAVILDNYAFMANVGDAEINEFVLDKFKKCWYRYTLADKHAAKHMGAYLRNTQVRNFLNDLGAPLGIVVWDAEGTKKYKDIREQVRMLSDPAQGISYRKMQQILCDVTLGAHMMPYEEKVKRQEILDDLALKRAAIVIQAMYKGKKSRAALGVKKGAATSEADAKAKDFKKRFMTMLGNPSSVKAIAPPPPAAGASLAPGVTPTAPAAAAPAPAPAAPAGGSMEAEVDGVRNIFKERAAQRAAARASKGA